MGWLGLRLERCSRQASSSNRSEVPTPAGPDALTFDLMSIGGKIRAGLGALGFKAPMPGQRPALSTACRRRQCLGPAGDAGTLHRCAPGPTGMAGPHPNSSALPPTRPPTYPSTPCCRG